jgi:hypothetical protein
MRKSSHAFLRTISLGAFLLAAALAAAAPLWRDRAPGPRVTSADFPGWPTGLVAADWREQPLSARDARFARDFPGRVGVFTTPEGRTVIVRYVVQPTRKLHPAADCLRALGYTITPGPLLVERADGGTWATLTATRASETVRARERLLGGDGSSWTDISQWYWAATLGSAEGPWWAVTELTY